MTANEIPLSMRIPVPLKEGDILEVPKCSLSPSFADEFNANPLATIDKYMDTNYDVISNDYALSRILFYHNSLNLSAITNFFLSRKPNQKSLLFYYFTSFNMDYMDLSNAARIALSRIAFPNDKEAIQLIIQTFCEAYLSHNNYFDIEIYDAFHLTRASILFSLRAADNQEMTKAEFQSILNKSAILTSMTNLDDKKDFIDTFFDDIKRVPIPIFFTFMETIEPRKIQLEGELYKINSRTKKKKYFELTETDLLYYKAILGHKTGSKEQQGTFVLDNVSAQFNPQPKNPHEILIKKKDGKPFGFTVSKKETVQKARKSLTLCGKNHIDMENWIKSINYNSFVLSLKNATPMQ